MRAFARNRIIRLIVLLLMVFSIAGYQNLGSDHWWPEICSSTVTQNHRKLIWASVYYHPGDGRLMVRMRPEEFLCEHYVVDPNRREVDWDAGYSFFLPGIGWSGMNEENLWNLRYPEIGPFNGPDLHLGPHWLEFTGVDGSRIHASW